MATLTRTRHQPQIATADSTWTDLPDYLRARLLIDDIISAADWRSLGRRRLMIFGITRSTARDLDAIAAQEVTP